jgi:hypothetical protein
MDSIPRGVARCKRHKDLNRNSQLDGRFAKLPALRPREILAQSMFHPSTSKFETHLQIFARYLLNFQPAREMLQ